MGMGREPLWSCAHYQADSADAVHACGDSAGESVSGSNLFKGSLDYRLGVKDSWGPFPGAEMQWHLEAPTNPATMEFSFNLALPVPGRSGGSGNPEPEADFHHKIGAGWGIGAWADNSFFLEYAASRKLGGPLWFGNMRATYLATQIGEVLGDDFSQPLPSDRTLVFQAALGASFRLPDWVLAPDFIIPQINVTLPQVPTGERRFRSDDIPLAQWDASLGLGWGI
ncbi:MAG: hypothetical protein JWP91_1421 [Fibrobacteres bacterium]|nr:hypothetical protein [Fibrobacterota bacterium]